MSKKNAILKKKELTGKGEATKRRPAFDGEQSPPGRKLESSLEKRKVRKFRLSLESGWAAEFSFRCLEW